MANQFQFVPSLAGTGKAYVAAQMRIKDGGVNLQIAGPKGNREYGAAGVLNNTSVQDFLSGCTASLNSLAKTEQRYVPVLLRWRGNSRVNVQIPGSGSSGNRSYGFAEEFKAPAWLVKYLSSAQPAVIPAEPTITIPLSVWNKFKDFVNSVK